jgi:hypothetical protein
MQIVFFYTTKILIINAAAQKGQKSGHRFPEPAKCAKKQSFGKPWQLAS